MNIYCTKCGAPVPEGAKFCQKCGAEVKAAPEAAQHVPHETDQHAPQEPPRYVPYEVPSAPGAAEPEAQRYDGFAIASFVCALTIVFWWLGIIFGIIALVRMGGNKKLKGMWMAIVGIVIGPIVGIMMMMAAILVPNFMRARAHGQMTACESNMKNIGTACEMYATDNVGRYPPSLQYLTPDYLQALPRCISTDLEYGYESAIEPDAYTIWCSGASAHTAVGVNTGFPQYSSHQGLMTQ
ncbi:MAG: zinc-ribbon domain-containing protein [Chloroflexi bacterium]|nr:zinc-ribbon domain-containing protein [Chloroflexota bacterium]